MSHSCFYDKGCQTGPPAYSPYPRRLESITICWCNYKGSTFYSVISRPWVLNESNSRPPWQLHAQPTEPPVRGYGFFRSKQTLLCCISPLIDCWTHFTNLRLSLVYQSATFNFIVFFFDTSAAIEIVIDTFTFILSQPTLLIFQRFFGAPFAWLKLLHHLYIKQITQ